MTAPGPRRDTRGIVDAAELLARVRFRRRSPAPELRPYLEHYWLIDWDLTEPYASHVVPHPSVNLVFERSEGAPGGAGEEAREGRGAGTGAGEGTGDIAVVSGIGLELFTKKLTGRGRVCGVQFRPGGFRPFAPAWPASHWTGRIAPLTEAFPDMDPKAPDRVLSPDDDHARVAALDAFLLAHGPTPDRAEVADPTVPVTLSDPAVPAVPATRGDPAVLAAAEQAMALVDLVRTDRTMRRVSALARTAGLSPRSLQRLFAAHVGVGPKWVILRYRIHEALERAESGSAASPPDWARLAAELGYSDQAHLVRDFTATVGVPPTTYARYAQ
ncbi:helix-turn-helix domain-containing protein [Streptomyces sp. NPDC051921]|uniref:helix-turn-helix domain-containing protein n=1 Tax=Streptomyces sp. NPDC051921 TaxID=3155806 RepID=UPI0034354BD3